MDNNKLLTIDVLDSFLRSGEEKDELLNKFVAQIENQGDLTLESGMVGLGWLVCFLQKHGMLDVCLDEVLWDIDDLAYNLTIQAISANNADSSHILELITFYNQRILTVNNQSNQLRSPFILECLKLLLDKIVERINSINIIDKIQEFCAILSKLSFLMASTIKLKDVEDAFYTATERFLYQIKTSREIRLDQSCVINALIALHYYNNPTWNLEINNILSEDNRKENTEIIIAKDVWKFLKKGGWKMDDLSSVLIRPEVKFFIAANFKAIQKEK